MNSTIQISGIIEESIVDGPGIRFVVFAQGCKHNCTGCHNPETHSFTGGYPVSISKIIQQVENNPLLDGVTFSGGEPFEQAASFATLALAIKEKGLNVITYSGYTFEAILEQSKKEPSWALLLENTDLLIDGPFLMEKRNLLLPFRGSENQRIIDVKESLAQGRAVISQFFR